MLFMLGACIIAFTVAASVVSPKHISPPGFEQSPNKASEGFYVSMSADLGSMGSFIPDLSGRHTASATSHLHLSSLDRSHHPLPANPSSPGASDRCQEER